ncbi:MULTISPECIES: hypothetical protein [Bacillus amyloliquefaciens group]|uniref:hypothetical protein n=1 Tax=Bacillus amyloliquefaciens group TaxID=1938374 RepID=UPI00073C5C35|nr:MULTISPECIES: hypothetical protein [Bacillus amyloliquefaciens group]KTF59809.1 hypothetical protein AR691_13830 [Bacillus amyloliquefaciens]
MLEVQGFVEKLSNINKEVDYLYKTDCVQLISELAEVEDEVKRLKLNLFLKSNDGLSGKELLEGLFSVLGIDGKPSIGRLKRWDPSGVKGFRLCETIGVYDYMVCDWSCYGNKFSWQEKCHVFNSRGFVQFEETFAYLGQEGLKVSNAS